MAFGGDFSDEKKLNLLDAALTGVLLAMLLLPLVKSMLEELGLFRSFVYSLSGGASTRDTIPGDEVSGSVTGIPNGIGALEPENQELTPPLCFSSIRMIPASSPVSVGKKCSSNSCCIFSFVGLERSGLVELSRDLVRNGKSELSDRWFVCVCRRGNISSSKAIGGDREDVLELRVAGFGRVMFNFPLSSSEKVPFVSSDLES